MNALSLLQSTMLLAAEDEGGMFSGLIAGYQKGGWGMYPITICMICMIVILFDRISLLFFQARTNKAALLKRLSGYIFQGDLNGALAFIQSQKRTPLTNIIHAGLRKVPFGEAEVQAAMDEAALRENPKIEARTGYLAMIGNAGMLCGLLGTVSGLITCFNAVAHVNAADKGTILSEGISEAMHCTAFGLGTAIPSLIGFSLLSGRTQKMLDDINEASVSILNLVVANKDKLQANGYSAAPLNAIVPENSDVSGNGGDPAAFHR